MNLSKSNFIGKFYELSYNEYPKDLCSFFWGTIWALVCFPLSVFSMIYKHYEGGDFSMMDKCVMGFVIYITYGILTMFGGGVFFGENGTIPIYWWSWIIYPLLGIIIVFLTGAIIVSIGWICKTINEKIKNKQKTNSKIYYENGTKDLWASIRGKYCTKITWLED